MSGKEEALLRAEAANQESFSKLVKEFTKCEDKFITGIKQGFSSITIFSKQQAELRILCLRIGTRYCQSDINFKSNLDNRQVWLRAADGLETMNLGLDSNGR